MTSSSEVFVNLSSSSPFAVAAMNEMRNLVLLSYLIQSMPDKAAVGSLKEKMPVLRSPLLTHTSLPLEGADL